VMQAREAIAAREAELTRQRELLNRRMTELAAREQALAQRERQIAEQRHIMSEEYRLLRQQQAERSAAAVRAGTRLPPSMPLPGGRGHSSRSSSLWHRVTRLFGGEAPVRS
jgi:hypothetical protein